MTGLRQRQRRRQERRRAEQVLAILELRAHYLELLSVTSKPGLLLHIIDAIDHADAQLDALDPQRHIPRGELVSIPRA